MLALAGEDGEPQPHAQMVVAGALDVVIAPLDQDVMHVLGAHEQVRPHGPELEAADIAILPLGVVPKADDAKAGHFAQVADERGGFGTGSQGGGSGHGSPLEYGCELSELEKVQHRVILLQTLRCVGDACRVRKSRAGRNLTKAGGI